MIDIRNCNKIFLYNVKVDMRMGLKRLQSMVAINFPPSKILNSVFIFCSKDNKTIKMYYENEYGFWLLQNRITGRGAKFQIPDIIARNTVITRKQLEWLCQGLNVVNREIKHRELEERHYFYSSLFDSFMVFFI